MIPWLVIGLLVFLVLLSYILKWKKSKNIAHLPTHTYLPIVGTMYKLIGGSEALQYQLSTISDIIDSTNLPFCGWAGASPIIIIQDPADMRLVTNAFVEKPYLYGFGKVWLSNSLAMAPGHVWKQNIKSYAQALSLRSVKTYQDVLNSHAKELVNRLKSADASDTYSQINYASFEAICNIISGLELRDLISIHKYHETITSLSDNLIRRMTNIFYHPECIYRRTKDNIEFRNHVKVIHQVSKTVLKKYDEKINKDDIQKSSFRPFIKYFEDIGLSKEDIQREIDLLILTQDPLATTLLMAFLSIGSRHDIQDKLFNEMKEIFGDSNRDVTQEDLEKMTYCDGVIREALRLYPPGPLVLRNADQNLRIKSCEIPKGSICVINIWGSGRSWRLWGHDVLEYRPERWLEPATPLPPITAFSMGKRGCVGEKYAYRIMKTIMAYAVRELVFEADMSKMKFKFDLVLRICEGLETFKICKREATTKDV